MKKIIFIILSIAIFACTPQTKQEKESRTVAKYSIEQFYQNLSVYGGSFSFDESQLLVKKAAREAEAYSWDLVKKEDEKTTQFAKSKGMIFVDPINEKEDWQAKARSIWPDFYFRVGGKELVDSILEITKDQ